MKKEIANVISWSNWLDKKRNGNRGFKGEIFSFIAGSPEILNFQLYDNLKNPVEEDTELKYILKKHGKPNEIIFEKFGSNILSLSADETKNLNGEYDLFIDVLVFDEYGCVIHVNPSRKMQFHIMSAVE